jgi:hypothetical protein
VKREKGKNTAASIRTRLLALAQSKGEDYQRVLGRYAIERFLYRLGRSPYRDKFALKGATLFTLWTGQTHRPTKDLDLLGQGLSAIGAVEQTIRAICEIQEEDGLVFDSTSVEGRPQVETIFVSFEHLIQQLFEALVQCARRLLAVRTSGA